MYLNFYNLKKEPFQITPDPEFLFLSLSHKEALAAIMYGVEQRRGFIAITGEVGVGKTTIIRSYLEEIDKETLKTIYIFNPNLSFSNLLKTIFEELGIDAETEEPSGMVTQLYRILIDEYKKGCNVALVIDEAQNMPVETLENLRMLSNLETSKDKLIQIVLVGQPEFDEMLKRKELRQLKQRIAIKGAISPLTKDDCMAYIRHRLTKASSHGSIVFTERALKKIIAHSHGIPRIINILCDNALITGFGYQKERISVRVAKEVITDFKGQKGRGPLKWVLAAVSFLLVAGIFAAVLSGNSLLSRSELAPKFSGQEKQVSQELETTGNTQTGHVDPAKVEVQPLVNKATTGAKKEPSPVIRSVRKGDNLLKLVREIYGYNDEKLIKLVMQNNPGITSSDKILIGDEIIFPARGEKGKDQ